MNLINMYWRYFFFDINIFITIALYVFVVRENNFRSKGCIMRKKRILLLSVLTLLVVVLISAPVAAHFNNNFSIDSYRYYGSVRQQLLKSYSTFYDTSTTATSTVRCGWKDGSRLFKFGTASPYLYNGQSATVYAQWVDVGVPYTPCTVELQITA